MKNKFWKGCGLGLVINLIATFFISSFGSWRTGIFYESRMEEIKAIVILWLMFSIPGVVILIFIILIRIAVKLANKIISAAFIIIPPLSRQGGRDGKNHFE